MLHLKKSIDGSLNNAVGVGRALALSKNIFHTDTLQNGAHSTTGNNTSTWSCRFQKHLSTAVFTHLLVRNSTLKHRDTDKILLCIVNALLNGGLNFLSLTKTIANNTILVSNNDDGSKGECTTTLGDFRDTINCDKTVLELYVARLNSIYV